MAPSDERGSPNRWGGRIIAFLNEDVKADWSSPPPVPRWVLYMYIYITILLVIASTGTLRRFLFIPSEIVVPWYIYLAAAFGTIGYILSNLASQEVQTFTALQAAARFWAAFPIAAGVYYLSQLLLDEAFQQALPLAGVAFLAGFSMEIFVQGFNVLANRILGVPEPKPMNATAEKEQRNHNDQGE